MIAPNRVEPNMPVIVMAGSSDMSICCYGITRTLEGHDVWWIDVDHGGGSYLPQMYHVSEIAGVPSVNLLREDRQATTERQART